MVWSHYLVVDFGFWSTKRYVLVEHINRNFQRKREESLLCQLNAVQKRLPKKDIAIVVSDLNVKMSAKHDFGNRKDNGQKFIDGRELLSN